MAAQPMPSAGAVENQVDDEPTEPETWRSFNGRVFSLCSKGPSEGLILSLKGVFLG